MISGEKVIIFGATGKVGSATARAAHANGAKVFLAVRDLQKEIPGFGSEQEASFKKVYADLTKPDTVHAAVTKTGASRAFIYLVKGIPDHMKASIEALQSAGIDFVGFLSTQGVPDSPTVENLTGTNFIVWGHGHVEIVLKQVFGDKFVAIRPGFFATNSLRWKEMTKDGEISMVAPEGKFDFISSDDIGRVCGAVLAKGFQDLDGKAGPNIIELCGPELLAQAAAATTIGSVIGKKIKVTELDEQGGVNHFMRTAHLPEPLARQMVKLLSQTMDPDFSYPNYEGIRYEEAVANIQKYGGDPPTKFPQWVEENKVAFGG